MGSGPDALLGFRLQSSFMMPGTDIVISGIGWYLLCSEGGTEWLPILSLSMPFCKTWVASWFSDRGAFFLRKPFEIADWQYQLCPYSNIYIYILTLNRHFYTSASVDVKPVSNCFRVVVCLNSFLEKISWLVQRCVFYSWRSICCLNLIFY